MKGAVKERAARIIFALSATAAILAVGLICVFLFAGGIPGIIKIGVGEFLFGTDWSPTDVPASYGILPMIVGSVYVTVGAIIIGVPVGLFTAVFMAFICPKPLYKILKPAVDLLAGIPSVVYGFFGMVVLVPFIRNAFNVPGNSGNNVLTASILLGMMIPIHATLLPYISSADELKTKPTQHSVHKLREIGIEPDVLLCRTEYPIPQSMKRKISLFCSVPEGAVIEAMTLPSIYHLPEAFEKQGLTDIIINRLGLTPKRKNDKKWFKFVKQKHNREVNIAIAGKYAELKDAYKSVSESLYSAGMSNKVNVKIKYVNTEKDNIPADIKGADGIIIPGGFGPRGIEGKLKAIKYARESKVPALGICLGMQCFVIEAARNMCGLKDADSVEFNPKTKNPVITIMAHKKIAGEMRLGNYASSLQKGSLAHKLYGAQNIQERHRHRYEFNTDYAPLLAKAGLHISGLHNDVLAEIVERRDHPFFIAGQFHPEFGSRPTKPHPLFDGLVKAAIKHNNARRK